MKLNELLRLKFLLILVFLFNFSIIAQTPQSKFWSKIRYGGIVSVDFGNRGFSGIVAPSALYDVSPYFSAGLGLQFGYTSFSDVKLINYGAGIIGLFNPITYLQLSTELELVGVSRTFERTGFEKTKDDYWYPALFLGAGYRTGNFSVGVRYDILYDKNKSIYGSPWGPFVRFYF